MKSKVASLLRSYKEMGVVGAIGLTALALSPVFAGILTGQIWLVWIGVGSYVVLLICWGLINE